MRRSKRKFVADPETYSESLKRWKEEHYDLLLDGVRSEEGSDEEGVRKEVCDQTDIVSEERSDYLQVRCEVWWMPELDERAHELRFTPAGVKIYEHWGKTKDVYYLRRNYERFMTMRPWSCLLYTSPSPRDLSTSRMPSSA